MKALAHRRALPSEALTPSPQRQRTARATKENVDPAAVAAEPSPFRSPLVTSKPLSTRNRSPLPPRPPAPSSAAHKTGSNPLKRKLSLETLPEDGVPASVVASDSGVQVIVRIRPPNSREDEEEEGGKQIVQMISPYSVSILDHTFSFDSIADVGSTQEDIFKLVGLPLVENCLAGFNSSIFAYGQTGSGKTYTMWGPPSALSGDDSSSVERGLTPRVFELLFSRIDEEQAKHAEKQLNYQCRCSFLEIYNEQITDLLEPTQRNLQIREDVRTGVYVDYLTEEYVCTMKDVIQLLIKGLANRRMSATSINAESSRSHCVFTCVVESRSKSMADGLSSLRISRINLVDLAGSERQKLTGAVGERLKEAGNINRSLSQLGNLINILAEVSQSGKQRHIPYRDSKLTFLLQESLGGNAKLAMICAISPSQSCKNESISTLRFAQRAKAIKNKAVVNEITQDDVNVLREQIRQLKDELLRMKSKTSADDNSGYSTGWNARRSLNLLRMSLSRPTALPVVKEDSDEEMEIDDDDVERPCTHEASQSFPYEDKAPVQSDNLKEPHSGSSDAETVSGDLILMDGSDTGGCGKNADGMTAAGGESCEINVMEASPPCPKADMGANGCQDNGLKVMVPADNKSIQDCSTLQMTEEMILVSPANNALRESNPAEEKIHKCTESTSQTSGDLSLADPSSTSSISPSSSVSYSSLSIVPYQTSPILQSPALSISPRVESYTNKSLLTFSSLSASKKDTLENDKSSLTLLNLSFGDSLNHKALNASLVRVNRSSRAPTEHLAASLQRGLQIIDNGKQSSALSRSSFRFSIKPIDLKPLVPVQKVDVGLQTLPLEFEVHEDSSSFICAICKNKAPIMEHRDVSYEKNLQLIPVDVSQSSDKLKSQVPKAVEKVLAGAFRREMALEDHCAKQAAQIAQLNRLVEQYKHERECNAIIEQTREDKISRLEGLMDGILPTEDFMEEEFISLQNEHKLLKEKYENHPEVLRINIELRRVQYELDGYRNFFDLGERDVLLEEIQDLRSQLQSYVDSSSMSTKKLRPLLQLAQSIEPMSTHLSTILESTKESVDEKIEEERLRWTETESKWISICEELRIELEASRSLAEKQKMELDCERTCKEELKEALETAMLGHARILEQYAELEEKHINLLGRHRQIRDGIADVKKAATKAGVKGAESKFIDALATEISAIKVEREKERRYWRDENKGLKTQLRDTAEAVQAAGELLVRLKEAEETAATAQKRSLMAEQETEKAYQEIDNLKKNYDREIVLLKQYLAESRLPKEAVRQESTDADVAKYDGESLSDQKWREEFEPFYQGGDAEFCSGTEPPSWFSGYDRCNI